MPCTTRSPALPGPLISHRLGPRALALLCASCVVTAFAQESPPREQRRVFIDMAHARSGMELASVGLQLPWAWRRPWLGGELSGLWDAHVARWHVSAASGGPGRRQWTQLALVPTLRLRFDGGRSPWFVEGGIGLSVIDGHVQTRDERFSTRFNFTDHLGVGVNLGNHWQHQLLLAVRHVSNGSIRKPNPGESFLQLRYGLAF